MSSNFERPGLFITNEELKIVDQVTSEWPYKYTKWLEAFFSEVREKRASEEKEAQEQFLTRQKQKESEQLKEPVQQELSKETGLQVV